MKLVIVSVFFVSVVAANIAQSLVSDENEFYHHKLAPIYRMKRQGGDVVDLDVDDLNEPKKDETIFRSIRNALNQNENSDGVEIDDSQFRGEKKRPRFSRNAQEGNGNDSWKDDKTNEGNKNRASRDVSKEEKGDSTAENEQKPVESKNIRISRNASDNKDAEQQPKEEEPKTRLARGSVESGDKKDGSSAEQDESKSTRLVRDTAQDTEPQQKRKREDTLPAKPAEIDNSNSKQVEEQDKEGTKVRFYRDAIDNKQGGESKAEQQVDEKQENSQIRIARDAAENEDKNKQANEQPKEENTNVRVERGTTHNRGKQSGGGRKHGNKQRRMPRHNFEDEPETDETVEEKKEETENARVSRNIFDDDDQIGLSDEGKEDVKNVNYRSIVSGDEHDDNHSVNKGSF